MAGGGSRRIVLGSSGVATARDPGGELRVLWIGDACCSTGFSRCTHAGCDALHAAGHEVVVLGLNFYGRPGLSAPYPYTIEPAHEPLDGGKDYFGFNRWLVLLDRLRPDAVVMLQDGWNIPGYFQFLDRENESRENERRDPIPEPPVIGWLAADAINQKGAGLERLAHVITWTEFARREFAAGGYEGTSSVIGLGVDGDLFRPVDRAVARREALKGKVPEDAFVVGVVGRNQERKRLDLTLQYFAEWVHESGIDDAYLYLHVAPTGDTGCDIDSLVSFYGLGPDAGDLGASRVILSQPHVGSGINEQSMRDLYGCFDLYWTTSMGEGWGLPALEAMACGVPCLLPNSSAFLEWPGDAAAGVDCTARALVGPLNMNPYTIGAVPDKDESIRALDWLYRNPTARERFSKAGLKVAARLTWGASGEALVQIIEEVVTGTAVEDVRRAV